MPKKSNFNQTRINEIITAARANNKSNEEILSELNRARITNQRGGKLTTRWLNNYNSTGSGNVAQKRQGRHSCPPAVQAALEARTMDAQTRLNLIRDFYGM